MNRLIEMVLLSTHNICFVWEVRKLNFRYTLLTKVLVKKLSFIAFFFENKFHEKFWIYCIVIHTLSMKYFNTFQKFILYCTQPNKKFIL